MAASNVCRDCGGTIRWIRTRAGKAMPVEPVPDPGGIVAATSINRRDYFDGRVITAADPPAEGETRFRPHWADCPRGKERIEQPEPTQQPLF